MSSILFYILLFFSTPTEEYQQITPLKASMQRGSELYEEFCMQCHLPDGKGSSGLIPPLAGSDWLKNKRKESIHAVKYGQSGPIIVNGKKYNGAMAPMGLTDKEVADVMNYIMNSWGNKSSKMVTEEEVKLIKK
ncbi:MAG: c-type cytochrome [Flavobacterium sp.]